jgi:hypothetical protein
MDPEDLEKAKSCPFVYAYLRKPLTIPQLKEFATLSI